MKDFVSNYKKNQQNLQKKVLLEDRFGEIDIIGGVDQAFVNDEKIISAMVLFDSELEQIESSYVVNDVDFPYIPGYLAFREGPSIIEVFEKIDKKPDVLFVDGSGILHPRFLGLASFVGIKLGVATIGVIKNLLCGEICSETKDVGETSKIKYKDKVVGFAYKSKENCNPIYVSPGHRISLDTSLKLTKKVVINHKLPKPIFQAHKNSNKIKKEFKG